MDSLPRKERRKLAADGKRIARKYNTILKRLRKSGAKFPADKILREFSIEYTHRYASSGIHNQPINFNYFEPFLHVKLIENAAPYTEIEQEFNHLFHATDFFDYVTSSDSNGFSTSSLLDLPQDQIYHYSTCGEVTDVSFLNGEAREFVIAGFSMIRRGNSIHWYLIGGEALGQKEWDIRCENQLKMELGNLAPAKRAFLAEELVENGNQTGKPVSLDGTDTHLRTIIAGEFDVLAEKHLSRCYLAEFEHTFDVVCDDPEVFSSFEGTEHGEIILATMSERFRRSAVLWSLAEGLFQLPRYFESRLAINKNTSKNSRKRIPKKKGGKGINAEYVVIPALETRSAEPTSTITMVGLPHYQIETEGHWKKTDNNQSGVDRHGNSVPGKTWVASSSKWKLTDSTANEIFLKDSLAAARLKISEYLAAIELTSDGDATNNGSSELEKGELYVMRCPLMKEQIYKVGFTTGKSSERARQLSSATGVPLAFVVIQCWKHEEAKSLELEVHMMLSPYRVNDVREFFEVEFTVIENVINSVLERTE